jgi:protein-tyrosine phosphatase
MTYLKNILTFSGILLRRLREQGLLTTLKWLYAVGIPYLTGHIPLRYSKITDQVYLGAQHGRGGLARLRDEGIEAVVNLRDESDDEDNNLLLTDYCYLPVVDNTAPRIDDLKQGVQFIRDVVAAGDKVYIHCASGVGRAPTMVAAYLVAEGDDLETAIQRITQARPFIRILPDQKARLREYEAHLKEQENAA